MTPETLRRKLQKKAKRLRYSDHGRCVKCNPAGTDDRYYMDARVGHYPDISCIPASLREPVTVRTGPMCVVLTCRNPLCGATFYRQWSGGGTGRRIAKAKA